MTTTMERTAPPSSKTSTGAAYRRLRFSVRGLVIALTVACVWLGLTMNRVRRQHGAVEWIRSQGGIVYYDFEWQEESGRLREDAPPPGLVRSVFGADFSSRPLAVYMSGYFFTTRGASYPDNDIVDITRLSQLPSLRYLSLAGTQVTDLAPLAALTQLRELDLSATRVQNVSPLARLPELRKVYLGPRVEQTAIDQLRRALPNCSIIPYASPVS
ncbi:MAG: leucine-rich repeat domain-containing protein [Planctomycetales bacterium]|nr:leucine-rich repeat domain-containing protein [Planctomycetales bacterium]